MNIVQFATEILSRKNCDEQRKLAAAGLKRGLEVETSWTYQHRAEVKVLIQFLESDSMDVKDIDNYYS